jgi:hypothetical protein
MEDASIESSVLWSQVINNVQLFSAYQENHCYQRSQLQRIRNEEYAIKCHVMKDEANRNNKGLTSA